MASTVYLFTYNNYYNRTIKRANTINDYLNDPTSLLTVQLNNFNFNPADGIDTSIIANYFESDWGQPNYCIVVDEYGVIDSRWFIIEENRMREGQYSLKLHRDLIADTYTIFIQSPAYIERATAAINNAFIFNSEGNAYNQIKTSVTTLKDKSNVPWIIGYIDRKQEDKVISIPSEQYPITGEYSSLSEYPFYRYTLSDPYLLSYEELTYILYMNNGGVGKSNNFMVGIDTNGNLATPQINNDRVYNTGITNNTLVSATGSMGQRLKNGVNIKTVGEPLKEAFNAAGISTSLYNTSFSYTGVPVSSSYDTISDENGSYISVNGVVYRVNVHYTVTEWKQSTAIDSSASQYFSTWISNSNLFTTTNNGSIGSFYFRANGAYVTLEKIATSSLSFNISSSRRKLNDAPYDMFAMPYGSILFGIGDGNDYSTNREFNIKLASTIATELGSSCYDVQILPYSPLPDYLVGNFSFFDLEGLVSGRDYELIRETNQTNSSVKGVVFWLSSSNFTKELNYRIDVPSNNIELKVANETDVYRLSSPNYASQFEFSPAKNRGVKKFEVSCSYKPFNPYIKVAPQFNGLYGNNFIDARGLILNGDFSMTRIESAWVQYELQNKNYNEIFERNIKSMDTVNTIQTAKETAAATTGAITAGMQGAMMANMAGMGGAGMGAVAGITGAISGAAGAADVLLNRALREESKSLYMDMFRLQNENVKAMPQTLSKVSAINPDNLLFPILEYYTATPEEKNALKESLKYRGMSINAISTVEDYLQPEQSYIKGKLIRVPEGLAENYHYIDALNAEFNLGIYI